MRAERCKKSWADLRLWVNMHRRIGDARLSTEQTLDQSKTPCDKVFQAVCRAVERSRHMPTPYTPLDVLCAQVVEGGFTSQMEGS